MSSNLLWKPTGQGKSLGCDYGSALKDALRHEFGPGTIELGHGALPFLRGLRAAKVEGAERLIELIEQHDSIDVWEVW